MNSCNDIGRCRQGSNASARCCTHDCHQGRDCPARPAPPTATPLDTANSDGTSAGHAIDEFLDDTGLLIMQGMALVGFVVSSVM